MVINKTISSQEKGKKMNKGEVARSAEDRLRNPQRKISIIYPYKMFMKPSEKIQHCSSMKTWKFTLISVLKLRINIKCIF